MVARAHHLVEGRDLEGEVIELDIRRLGRHRADQRHAVVIRVAAQEHHAARHHLLGIDVGNAKPQHLDIEPRRALDIADIQDDVPDLADLERQPARPLQFPDPVGIVRQPSPFSFDIVPHARL